MRRVLLAMTGKASGENVRWAFKVTDWRPTLEELKLACSCIQEEEKHRLAKFVFRNDFDASLVGRLMMRKFVSEATGVDYSSVLLERDERQKPFWRNSTGINVDFNVSHQGDYCVLAGCVSRECHMKIGVDVMKIEYSGGKSLSEFFRLMTKNFSPFEWKSIFSRSRDVDQIGAFMRHWCLKEAYVKNLGVGITVDLQRISFQLGSMELTDTPTMATKLFLDEKIATEWKFEESLIDSQHCVAVSLLNTPQSPPYVPPQFERVTFEQLMQNAKPLLPIDDSYCHNIQQKEYKS
ncbi:4'-phosphopantetheinyl transferase [Sergentomyia squamirostris]